MAARDSADTTSSSAALSPDSARGAAIASCDITSVQMQMVACSALGLVWHPLVQPPSAGMLWNWELPVPSPANIARQGLGPQEFRGLHSERLVIPARQ
jgi:hypothetical protein